MHLPKFNYLFHLVSLTVTYSTEHPNILTIKDLQPSLRHNCNMHILIVIDIKIKAMPIDSYPR